MSGKVRPLVVGVDGSLDAIHAAQWAAAVSEKYAAPLHIVHAEPYLGHNFSDAVASIRAAAMAEQQESSEAILRDAEHAVRGGFPELEIAAIRIRKPVNEALRAMSEDARLIVLGCDDTSLGAAVLVGSTTIAVVTHSACPVVAWRGEFLRPTTQQILLGVDGSKASGGAIAAAFEFAELFGVGIVAVHAWSRRRPPGEVTIPYLVDWDALEEAECQHLKDVLKPWRELYPTVDVDYFVDPHKPSRAMLRHADDTQLIVIGSHGRGIVTASLLGSTGFNLLHHAAVPVMICRGSNGER